MSEFNGITGFEGWSAKLKSLLEEAKISPGRMILMSD